MVTTGTHLKVWTWCIATLVVTLATGNFANAVDVGGSGRTDCSAREVLILGLVEGQGAAPNAVSEKLVAESNVIGQAQTVCDYGRGRVRDGLALYDRVIAELVKAAPQRGE